jgi:hypothetical protein
MSVPPTHLGRAAVTVLVLSLVRPGWAQPVEETENDPRVAEAQAACLAGDVQRGARLLAELYVATSDARWLFNQARCYQQNRMNELAIARFREFLQQAPASEAELRGRASHYLNELRAAQVVTPPQPAPTPAPPSWRGRLRIASLASAALGLAGVATGVVMSARVNAVETQIGRDGQSATLQQPEDVDRKYAEGRQAARWQLPAYLIGGGLLAAGIAGYLFAASPETPSSHALLVVPVAGPGAGGAVARWMF